MELCTVKKQVKTISGSSTVISSLGSVNRSNLCIVFIPGNPGIIEFYDVFLSKLHKMCDRKVPVYGVAHAGHSPAWEYTNVTEGEDNLNLIDQIDHKIEFIREELPPDQQLILIGHSIGVYIVLKMLEIPFISKRLVHAVCLFPAIEHLKETPNGKFWMPVSKYCRFPLALLALSFSYMPIWFKNMLVAWRAKGRPVHEHLIKPCHSCVSFSLINRALYMAASEMEHLNEMDEQLVAVIQENIKKLTFYYGACDKWAPMSFFKRMVTRFPLADIRLCTSGYPHDFVLDSSEEVAKLCFDILISYEVL